MKFTTLAIIGAVVAKPGRRVRRGLEEDLTEDVHVKYPAEAVAKWMALESQLEHTGMAAMASFEKEWPTFEADMKKMGRWMKNRYAGDLMKWGRSGSVKAAHMHKKKMEKVSSELHTMMSDIYTLYNEFAHGGVEMGWGFKEDGSYEEWMSNKSVKHVFVEMYTIAKDFRAFYESDLAKNQRRLDALTLNDKNFHNFVGKVADDIDAHSWKEFSMRMHQVGMMIQKELKGCPYFGRAVVLMMKMHKLQQKAKIVSDQGSPEMWKKWWMKNKFENPFKGMDWKEEEMLI
jgi:hypothetical protein